MMPKRHLLGSTINAPCKPEVIADIFGCTTNTVYKSRQPESIFNRLYTQDTEKKKKRPLKGRDSSGFPS
jgi:hypothetical protein